jgi:hypothetical protein
MSLAALVLGGLSPAAYAQTSTKDADLVRNPQFEAVASRLDRNGTFFSYTDTEPLVRGMKGLISDIGKQLGASSELKDVPGKVDRTLNLLGIDQITAFGMSLANRKDGHVQVKSYLKLAQASGLYKQDAETKKPLRLTSYGPPNTQIALVTRWNPSQLWETGLEIVGLWAPEEFRQKLASDIKEWKLAGVEAEKVLGGLGRELLVAVLFDPEQTMALPLPDVKLEVPKPGLLVMVELRDPALADAIKKASAEAADGAKFEKGEKTLEGWDLLHLPVQSDVEAWAKPVLAISSEVVAFSLQEVDLARAVQARKDGKDFRSTPGYQSLGNGLPENHQGLFYVSPLVPQALRSIGEKVLATEEVPLEPRAQIQRFISQLSTFHGFASVQIWDEEGVQDVGRMAKQPLPGLTPSIPSAGVAVGTAGVVTAIAVPNFLEAQIRAKVSRSRSEMRSLATAIESYKIDFDVYPASTTRPEEMFGEKPSSASASGFKVSNPSRAMSLTTPIVTD